MIAYSMPVSDLADEVRATNCSLSLEPCVDVLHIAHCLPAHWASVQPLRTLAARYVVTTGTEHRGDQFIHAHSAQPLILDLEE